MGSKNVIISMGKEGSILISEKGVYKGNAPKGKLISSVGAGDSMVAGVTYGEKEEVKIKNSEFPEVLAVTACPTGIAHTYMAADSLIKKSK